MEDETRPREQIVDDDRQWRAWILLALTILTLWLAWLLTSPFVPALAWALVLALLFMPLQLRLEARTGSRAAAAGFCAGFAALFITIPALAIAEYLLRELGAGIEALGARLSNDAWMRVFEGTPLLRYVERIDLSEVASRAMESVTSTSAMLARATTGYIITFLVSFYLTFYLLRDRDDVLRLAADLSPLPPEETQLFLRQAGDTIHATVFGTLATASLQGFLGGVIFWWLALPHPFLWGAIMGVFAVVPILGAFVVWAPTALFLGLGGEWGKAALLAGWGVAVISPVDNLLYPMLVGNRLHLHTVPAFIALVGGVFAFGASGIVLGPLIVTTAVFLMRRWGARIPQEKKPEP